jgi:hypothetical protein
MNSTHSTVGMGCLMTEMAHRTEGPDLLTHSPDGEPRGLFPLNPSGQRSLGCECGRRPGLC